MFRDFSDMTDGDFKDFFLWCVGDRIGHGVSREVYHCKLNDQYVIKYEWNAGDLFQNVIEWKVWNTVSGTSREDYFAPCCRISPNGNFLLQRKVLPIGRIPKNVPAYLRDLKPEHFGTMDGRIVCCDYGTLDVSALNGFLTGRARKAML